MPAVQLLIELNEYTKSAHMTGHWRIHDKKAHRTDLSVDLISYSLNIHRSIYLKKSYLLRQSVYCCAHVLESIIKEKFEKLKINLRPALSHHSSVTSVYLLIPLSFPYYDTPTCL